MELEWVLERVRLPVSRADWARVIGDRAQNLPEAFVSFMERHGGTGIFSAVVKVGDSVIEKFLGGDGYGSVDFEVFLLDPDLRHFVPFAINSYGA